MKQFVILLLVFCIGRALAHDVADYDILSLTMDRSIERLSPDKIVIKPSSLKTDFLTVRYEGKTIYLDRSTMLEALGQVYDELGEELGYEEKRALESARESIFRYLSRKTIDFAKVPIDFFKNIVLNFPEESRHLSLELPKLIQSRGMGAFVVIATTQIAWEVVETAVSWAIGAGGAHAYCVVFNIALLRTVDNFRQFGQYLLSPGLNIPFKLRMRAFITSIKRDWRSGKKSLSDLPRKSKIREKYIQELFSSRNIDREISHSNSRQLESIITDDFKNLGKKSMSEVERIWLGYQISLGVEYLNSVLDGLVTSFMEKHYSGNSNHLKERKNIYDLIWKLRSFQGYVHQQKEKLIVGVTIESVNSSHANMSKSLIEMYNVFIESVSSMNKIIKAADSIIAKDNNLSKIELSELIENIERRLKAIKDLQKQSIYISPMPNCLKSIF